MSDLDRSKVFIAAERAAELEKCVQDQMLQGNVLLVVRGLPGTGKSFLGKSISDNHQGVHYESDSNFVVDGEYRYDPTLLAASHEATQSACHLAMLQGAPLVVVTNTFTRHWEYEPYVAAAASSNYTTVIFDLYKHLLGRLGITPATSSNYVRFLAENNTHDVPLAKLHEMADRYEFSDLELNVFENSTKASSKKRRWGHELLGVLDTGYYLGLEVKLADRCARDHTHLFQACVHACRELMLLFDAATAFQMVRKVMTRNMKSHGRGSSVGAMGGWARLHLTVLNAAEYEELQDADMLTAFKEDVDALRLDALAEAFAGSDLAASRATVRAHIGLVQGDIATPAGGTPQSVRLSGDAKEALGEDQASSFYLLLPPSEVVEAVRALRQKYLSSAELWQPHITLGFTHNDVHPADRAAGLATFRSLATSLLREPSQPTEQPVLDEDDGLAAELALHSETSCSFSLAQGLQVMDWKVRRGPFGDDMTYKAHPVLLQLLPRGLVFLQTCRRGAGGQRPIYRGLHSLRKFFGKEGMEDDGAGLSTGELNLRLHNTLGRAQSLVLMEKVNGRAASCRFFHWDNELLVLVGTKLAHTVGRVDAAQQRIVLEPEYYAGEAVDADGEDSAAESETKENAAEALQSGDYRNVLILSNTRALEASLHWEAVEDIDAWLRGRTLNGEVLDPEEMHLVALQDLQWVHLCLTDFAVVADKGLLEERDEAAKFLKFLPTIQRLDLDNPGLTKRDLIAQTSKAIVHSTEASEGRVMYFLDCTGRVLDMVKYKTWWYIYRRSIRQLAAKLLDRLVGGKAKSHKGAAAKAQAAQAAEIKKLEAQLVGMQRKRDGMLKARNKEGDAAFQQLLRTCCDGIVALEVRLGRRVAEGAVQELADRRVTLDVMTAELGAEVQRKWGNKFAFMREDLGPEQYPARVREVQQFAQDFLRFLGAALLEREADTVRRFKRYYPLMWEDFLQAYHQQGVEGANGTA